MVVTNYAKARYGYAGNTRFRLYRGGAVREEGRDMSLGTELVREKGLAEAALSRHEERNNLYSYLGQGKGFQPISGTVKLVNGDILALYTRGIWENLDAGELENYTFAAVFVNKVFLDPNRKRRIKKMIITTVVVLVIAAAVSLVIWLFHRQRQKRTDELELRYTNTIEYIQDNNFLRAEEECKEALKLAEKLRGYPITRS